MTAIVGLAEPSGNVWMGGDSAASCNGVLNIKANGKVFQRGEFLIGCSGVSRANDILRYVFEPPPITPDLDTYMVRDFARTVRDCFKEAGRIGEDEDKTETVNGRILVGVRGRLYELDGAFAVVRDADGYNAIGSGAEIALGVMYATEGRQPEERIQLALAAAERWTSDVRRPFTVLMATELTGIRDRAT